MRRGTTRPGDTAGRAAIAAAAVLALLFIAGAIVSEPADLSHVAYGFVCHQNPERSFALGDGPLAICARCTGLYLGGALALVWASFRKDPRRSPRGHWLAIACAPIAIDAAVSFLGGPGLDNVPRFLTSLPAGAVVGVLLASATTDLAELALAHRAARRA